jgi:hypothetical protein
VRIGGSLAVGSRENTGVIESMPPEFIEIPAVIEAQVQQAL